MEEKVYSRSVTKQAMSFRVVDKQQVDRHYNMAELSELYTLTKPDFLQRPTPQMPQDDILRRLLFMYPQKIYKYHEHDSLLENKLDEELSEEEKREAWKSYENDEQQTKRNTMYSSVSFSWLFLYFWREWIFALCVFMFLCFLEFYCGNSWTTDQLEAFLWNFEKNKNKCCV